MPQSPRRGHPHGLSAVVTVMAFGAAAPLLSCRGGSPVEPTLQAPDAIQQSAAAKGSGKVRHDDGALTIQDMLGDPMFRASVEGVVEPAVQEPLLGAVDALAAGHTNQATILIIRAQAEADALLDDPDADFDSLVWWALLERYFEEAELL